MKFCDGERVRESVGFYQDRCGCRSFKRRVKYPSHFKPDFKKHGEKVGVVVRCQISDETFVREV